jgi:hypothetical protein
MQPNIDRTRLYYRSKPYYSKALTSTICTHTKGQDIQPNIDRTRLYYRSKPYYSKALTGTICTHTKGQDIQPNIVFFLYWSSRSVLTYKRGEQVPSNTTSFNYKHIHLRATCFDLYQSSSGPLNKIIKNKLIHAQIKKPTTTQNSAPELSTKLTSHSQLSK